MASSHNEIRQLTAAAADRALAAMRPSARRKFLRLHYALCSAAPEAPRLNTTEAPRGELTKRQREIVCLVAQGWRTKEIAARLALSPRTVEAYRRRIAERLGGASLAEMVLYAVREGLVDP